MPPHPAVETAFPVHVISGLPLIGIEQQFYGLDHPQRVLLAGHCPGRYPGQGGFGSSVSGAYDQAAEGVTDQGVGGDSRVRMPRYEPAEPVPYRRLHHGGCPSSQPGAECVVPSDRQQRRGPDGPGEQRHSSEQVLVRLGQPGGVELQHAADPRIGAGRPGQIDVEGS